METEVQKEAEPCVICDDNYIGNNTMTNCIEPQEIAGHLKPGMTVFIGSCTAEPAEILGRLLPRYAEARLYAALLEGSASEHAARQRAMKAATDNAEDLKINLTRIMNRARQDAITTEIMEIVSGAEAMSQDGDFDLDDAITQSIEGSFEPLISDRNDA